MRHFLTECAIGYIVHQTNHLLMITLFFSTITFSIFFIFFGQSSWDVWQLLLLG
jgi:hypothetical protein